MSFGQRKAVVAIALVMLLTAGVVGYAAWGRLGATEPNTAPSAVLTLGEAVYRENCASCHGAQLEGQPNWRQRLPNGRLPAPPHDETGHTWHHSNDVLFQITKFGPQSLVSGDYQSDMPAFEDVLTDEEINAVIAYIESTWSDDLRRRRREANG